MNKLDNFFRFFKFLKETLFLLSDIEFAIMHNKLKDSPFLCITLL